MAASSTATIISCCLGPPAPAPPKQAARRPQAPAGVSVSSASRALSRACVAAAACAVVGMAGAGAAGDMALALARGGGAIASKTDAVAVVVGTVRAKPQPPRWSERRQCPPWRANSLENVVPENLPRPSAPRRFDSVSAPAAAPDWVMRPGTGCFSL